MTLTSGRGPLTGRPAGRFAAPVPSGTVYTEPHRRRVHATAGGRTVVDSERVLLVHRPGHPPAYAFPVADVAAGLGEPEPTAAGFVTVPWEAVDAWFEEDERVLGSHPKNPYHRVDCVRSHRRLVVVLAGTTLVDTTATVALYETSLEPRLYCDPGAVRTDLLVRSESHTYCGYKGAASYWSAVIEGVSHPDVAWSYDEPLAESSPIAGLLSFDETRTEVSADLPPPVWA